MALLPLLAVKRIDEKLAKKEFYDAHLFVCGTSLRIAGKGQVDNALRLCYTYAKEFAKAGEGALAASMGFRILKLIEDYELPIADNILESLVDLFQSIESSNESVEKFRFIEQTIKFSSDKGVSDPKIARLHRVAAEAYIAVEKYGRAQGHLLLAEDPEGLAELTVAWREKGYPTERDLFLLRIVLTFLATGKAKLARKYLSSKALLLDLDAPRVSPVVQTAYLLAEACILKNYDFFALICRKYRVVLRRDPVFDTFLSSITSKVFERRKQERDLNVMGLLSSLAGI